MPLKFVLLKFIPLKFMLLKSCPLKSGPLTSVPRRFAHVQGGRFGGVEKKSAAGGDRAQGRAQRCLARVGRGGIWGASGIGSRRGRVRDKGLPAGR
jgi:hypothetical protein